MEVIGNTALKSNSENQHMTSREKILLEESQNTLEKCREKAIFREKNKVALIQPRKGGRPAMGLLYIGAYLRDNQFDVRIFEFLDETYPPNLKYNRKLMKTLEDYNPDFIGFGIISSAFRMSTKIIKQIRSSMPGKTIICGGKHATSNPEDLLRCGADVCTIGEAEITIVELLDALNFNRQLNEIRGIAYLSENEVHHTPQRPFLPIDHILWPAYDLVNYEKYIDFRLQAIPGHYLRTGFVFGSRGCPYKCKFCTTNIRGSYRERNLDDMINEMEWQIEKYNVEAFVILDDLFYFRDDRTMAFCDKIKERNIQTKFYCYGRVDRVHKETIQKLKDAGCLLLGVGVESGSQRVLDAMNKGTTLEKIENAFKIYNEVGINTYAFIIVGHIDETPDDREETRRLLEKINSYNVGVAYYMPMPGTPSYDFEIRQAKYLLGDDDFVGFTYTTDYPEFSTSIPLKDLKKIGDEFESMSRVNRNKNILSYPAFISFLIWFIVCHPYHILEGLYYRYVLRKTYQLSIFSLLKDIITFYKQRFYNP